MSTRSKSRLWLRYVVALCVLIPLLFACRRAEPPVTPPVNGGAAETIGADGGELSLPDGSYVQFEADFFSADSRVGFSSFEPLLGYYPEGVGQYYPVDQVEAVGPAVELELDYSTLNLTSGAGLSLNLPLNRAVNPEVKLRAEVFVRLADGSEHFYLEDYAPDSDTSGGLALSAAQFTSNRGDESVLIIARPVVVRAQLESNALPSGFIIEDVVSGLTQGVGFEFAAGGRIFIAEKRGVVRLVQNGTLLPDPFIDISPQVNNRADRGMLGITVHPEFPAEPYVYLLFTYDPPEVFGFPGSDAGGPEGGGARVARLIRVTADAGENYNRAVAGSERVLLGKNSTWANIGNPQARNDYSNPSCENAGGSFTQDCLPADELSHTIGTVKFGTDGALFVGNGDGCDFTRTEAACYRSQELDSLAGKLLRINPETGAGLSDNPFYNGNPNSNRSKVYALGLRNPFRFTVDEVSGEPYIGDVGRGTWEEVNRGRGANFGWPCFEGGNAQNLRQSSYAAISACQSLYNSSETITPAIYAYVHTGATRYRWATFTGATPIRRLIRTRSLSATLTSAGSNTSTLTLAVILQPLTPLAARQALPRLQPDPTATFTS